MLQIFNAASVTLLIVAGLAAQSALAETPEQILDSIQNAAKATPGFRDFQQHAEKVFSRPNKAMD